MILQDNDLQKDIDDIGQIAIIPSLLDVICRTTGMGFAAVARVTEDRWITCQVRDDIGFGLKPGDELQIKTTICNEIRDLGKAVIIDHVAEDPDFKDHHTPAMYGFQSYISVPILRKENGSFFGTLCAIDPDPHNVSSPAITQMFALFAELIAFHLNAIESLRHSETKFLEEKEFKGALEKLVAERTDELAKNNEALKKMNKELESFAYISSHDLQEPLRKIQTIASMITERESHNLSETGKDHFRRMTEAAQRMQALINDLLAYSRTSITDHKYKHTDLAVTVGQVISDLEEELKDKHATINVGEMRHANIIPFQFRQLLYNLITNSLKFSSPERPPVIMIRSEAGKGSTFSNSDLDPDLEYCHISISDNGIGFEQKYSEKIFEVFQRLYERARYKGTGIGLAIVKKIMENHNGIITATGEPDKGATFDIYFPVGDTIVDSD